MDRQAVNINIRSPLVLQPEKRCALKILGICEVIFGSGCVTFGFVFLFADYSISYYGAGIWCGILIVTAGSLGIASGSPVTIWCLVNLHTGFSMFGCVAAALLAYLSCASMLTWLSGEYRWETILHGLNVFFSFISCILLIVSASICCCCPSPLGYCGACSQEYEYDEDQHEEYELQNRSTGFTQQPSSNENNLKPVQHYKTSPAIAQEAVLYRSDQFQNSSDMIEGKTEEPIYAKPHKRKKTDPNSSNA